MLLLSIPLKYMHLIGLFCGIEMSRMFFLVPAVLVLAVHLGSQGELTMEQLFLQVFQQNKIFSFE